MTSKDQAKFIKLDGLLRKGYQNFIDIQHSLLSASQSQVRIADWNQYVTRVCLPSNTKIYNLLKIVEHTFDSTELVTVHHFYKYHTQWVEEHDIRGHQPTWYSVSPQGNFPRHLHEIIQNKCEAAIGN